MSTMRKMRNNRSPDQHYRARLIIYLCSLLLSACASDVGADGEGSAPASGKQLETERAGKADQSALGDSSCDLPASGFDPNATHRLRRGFEGWYYRFEDEQSGEGIVLITAYWGEGPLLKGFIELIESDSGAVYKATFEDLKREELERAAGKELDVEMGGLRFRADSVTGQFETDAGEEIAIDLSIKGCRYWGEAARPDQRRTMGWVTEAPLIPLKWYTHHLLAESDGIVEIDGRAKWFQRAKTHQEKNWGDAFPQRWVWLQANDFGEREVAFAAAGGPIFAYGRSPEGYMLGLQLEDRFIAWRTHDLHQIPPARFEIDDKEARWSMRAEGWRYRLELSARAPRSELIPIDVPTPDGLKLGAVESLRGELTLKLYERRGVGWRQVDELKSRRAALEAGGTLAADFLQSIRGDDE